MEYSKFCESTKNEIQRMMGEDYNVRLEHVVKNNHVVYEAIVILQKGKNIAPSIYLEAFYDDFRQGKNITDICLEIIVQYESYKNGIEIDLLDFMNYENIKDSVYVKVINTSMNEAILVNMPHRNIYNLSMTAYILFEEEGIQNATMNITNSHMKVWNIDNEKLFEDAIRNTKEKMPPQFKSMGAVMRELLDDRIKCMGEYEKKDEEMEHEIACSIKSIEENGDDKMFVLTNSKKLDGAVYILFDEVLEQIANKLQQDVYIIPSSIHEIIIVPKNECLNQAELSDMVVSVNNSTLDPMEILSNNVYVYERGKGINWDSI